MTAIARFEVIPVREGSMAGPIARAVEALERYDVTYETTPTDTVIEADTLEELFAAVRASHEAIADEHRVVTELEIDYQPSRPRGMDERVHAVERQLGRPPRSERAGGRSAGGRSGSARSAGSQGAGDRSGRTPARYEGGRRGQSSEGRKIPVESGDRGGSSRRGSSRRYGSRRY